MYKGTPASNEAVLNRVIEENDPKYLYSLLKTRDIYEARERMAFLVNTLVLQVQELSEKVKSLETQLHLTGKE